MYNLVVPSTMKQTAVGWINLTKHRSIFYRLAWNKSHQTEKRSLLVYSHCTWNGPGTEQGAGTESMASNMFIMQKGSHWSKTGTRTDCFLWSQSYSLYRPRAQSYVLWISHFTFLSHIINEFSWLLTPYICYWLTSLVRDISLLVKLKGSVIDNIRSIVEWSTFFMI